MAQPEGINLSTEPDQGRCVALAAQACAPTYPNMRHELRMMFAGFERAALPLIRKAETAG